MRIFIVFATIIAAAFSCQAQTACSIQEQKLFEPQQKPIALASRAGAPADAQFVLFQSGLRVNTDGAPNSYHPDDPKAQTKAINDIANALSVRRDGQQVSYAEKIRVFEEYRDHDWTVPEGYQMTWQNVLAARTENGRTVPCVFTAGAYKGYFGSLTTLKNGLPGAAAGECDAADQLDQRYVPALVIAEGSNPMKEFGAGIGDLVIAINPKNGVIQAAVVGDAGPPDNLGEGSVALDMALLKETRQPTNYAEAVKLDTGSQEIVVAIIPRSAEYKLQRPYSAENITARVTGWLAAHGYTSLESFSALAQECAGRMSALPNK